MPDERSLVAAGYDEVAERYAALESPGSAWPRMRRLEEVLSQLPAGSRVLDVGCGNGLPGLARIAERHLATGIDVSALQIAAARRNVPTAALLHADVLACDFPPESFDAIVAFYVVEHLRREEHAALFARFADWLRRGGLLLFTTELEEDAGTVGEWLGVPMFFSQFDPQTTTALVERAGFELVRREVEPQVEGGREISYVWFRARRRSS